MSNREIKVLSIIGLLFGIGVLYFGATSSCACPVQIVGQPAPFNEFQAQVGIGAVIIVVSVLGIAFSLHKSKNTIQDESGSQTTP